MAAVIHSISLTKEQEIFIDENPDISLSKITQNAIQTLMESSKITLARLKEEIRKRESFQKVSEEARIFIEKQGLLDKWLESRGFG